MRETHVCKFAVRLHKLVDLLSIPKAKHGNKC